MAEQLEQDAKAIAFERRFRRFATGLAVLLIVYLAAGSIIVGHFVWKYW